ncbi:septal ring lytic transglycosylase RlpA family protein [Azonexus hydrophilus]|jgi:rare lipoprotein A (peptidoglycan hydrolase)|uniref:septal ring lytic transglycosylase RlpA family protein n=1 Tax=Azonexus hydrophilus TaxID=418702 RepID=UPI0019656228|nr:septal ring lytic transglycosylase RlpA family protein [Azonexus hydrophilus]
MLVCGLASALLLTSPAAADITLAQGVEAVREGLASFYGGKFHGRRTASGERFDKKKFSAASNHFPLGTWLAVRRPESGQCAVVRVNDRMSRRQQHRIVDLSKGAADYLGMLRAGISQVQVVALAADFEARWQAAAPEEKTASCHAAFAPDDAIDLGDLDALPATAAGLLETNLPVFPHGENRRLSEESSVR